SYTSSSSSKSWTTTPVVRATGRSSTTAAPLHGRRTSSSRFYVCNALVDHSEQRVGDVPCLAPLPGDHARLLSKPAYDLERLLGACPCRDRVLEKAERTFPRRTGTRPPASTGLVARQHDQARPHGRRAGVSIRHGYELTELVAAGRADRQRLRVGMDHPVR